MSDQDARERTEQLVSKAVDGLLSDAETVELEQALERFPEYRNELEDFLVIKQTTDAFRARIAAQADTDRMGRRAAAKGTVGIGWVLLLCSAIGLIGFAMVAFFMDLGVPVFVRLSVAVGGGGLLLLLAFVIVQRSRSVTRDPYREIDR